MATKAETKRLSKPIKLKLRRGDTVMIISGKDKGQIGQIYVIDPKEQKAIVLKHSEDKEEQLLPLNAAVKHRKAKMQGERSARVKIPVPIHVSNLMIIDPTSNTPSRVGRRRDETGKNVRYAKKSGDLIPSQPMNWGKE